MGNRVVGAIVLSPTVAVSQKAVVGPAKPDVVARARASRDAPVQHCVEFLDSEYRIANTRGALGRLYSSRVYFQKLHHAFRMRRLT